MTGPSQNINLNENELEATIAPVRHLSLTKVCKEIWVEMPGKNRLLLLLGLICAIIYSAGTAVLPVLIKLPQQPYHQYGPIQIAHWPLIVMLTCLFLVRPLMLRGHVRNISKSLKSQIGLKADRGYGIAVAHYTLLVLTRDIPLLILLCGALAFNLGILTIFAVLIVAGGLFLASRVIKKHRKKAKRKVYDTERGFLVMRNARADTEAMSDLPQSLLIAGTVLWFGYWNEPFSGGLIASLIVNIMLASPPIRRLTKLYAKISLQTRGVDDDE